MEKGKSRKSVNCFVIDGVSVSVVTTAKEENTTAHNSYKEIVGTCKTKCGFIFDYVPMTKEQKYGRAYKYMRKCAYNVPIGQRAQMLNSGVSFQNVRQLVAEVKKKNSALRMDKSEKPYSAIMQKLVNLAKGRNENGRVYNNAKKGEMQDCFNNAITQLRAFNELKAISIDYIMRHVNDGKTAQKKAFMDVLESDGEVMENPLSYDEIRQHKRLNTLFAKCPYLAKGEQAGFLQFWTFC